VPQAWNQTLGEDYVKHPELELALAFTGLSDRMALDPLFRINEHPSFYEPFWTAYQEYLIEKMRKRKRRRKKLYSRGRGGKVHVSFISNPTGYNCDRALFYAITSQPQEPSTVVHPDVPWLIGALERCFWYGHAAEDEIYRLLGMALVNHYGDRLVVHELVFERSLFTDPPEVCLADRDVLAGASDIYIRYTVDDSPITTAVWDAKTISKLRSDAQKKTARKKAADAAAGARTEDVEASVDYQRQVSTYLEPSSAHHGGLLYWDKQWNHGFSQYIVDRRPGFYAATVGRIREVREDVAREHLSPATPSKSYCGRCPYRSACAGDSKLQEAEDAHRG